MAGYKDHRNALKPQNMEYVERVERVNKYNPPNAVKKLMKEEDNTILDNFGVYKHGCDIEKHIGRPLSYASVEEFDRQIQEYVNYCYEHQMTPMNNGLASWLGIALGTLKDWERNPANPFSTSIKNAIELFHNIVQQKTMDGEMNPVLYFFLAKNLWGFSDKTEIVHRSSTVGAIDLDEQERIINSTPGIVIDAEYSESKKSSEDLDTNRGTEDLEAEKGNLKGDLEGDLDVDLEKYLMGDLDTHTEE